MKPDLEPVATKLSVAICTFNRAEPLRVLLGNLVQAFDTGSPRIGDQCNVLVVDNNCSDHTGDVLREFASRLPLTTVFERRQGLSNARNRALRCFGDDAILFLDDDVSIDPETLATYLRALEAFPQFDYFGGPIEVDWQGKRPSWLRSDDLVLLNGLTGRYQPARQDKEYGQGIPGPYGANFLLRRRLVNQVGDFDTGLGVKGGIPDRGEETDWFHRARKLGANGLFLAACAVRHRFQRDRLNVRYLYRYGIAKGNATGVGPPESPGWVATGFVFRGCWQLLRGRVGHFYQCVINLGILRGQAAVARPDR